ncbi:MULTISPECIES: ShlB/FhaC/HecB family hemolysin secretion/activation protein [Methylomicrobium]|uniref:Hemolysin activation/secretion protein n=1 Tax=Methylomicrobium album BG8 TaxID=686340 RepID=H8GHW8_METAL|nr:MULTISPECIES: ShlB/FhaC/HecB family hemolysin secretion/activation protein [Methylomicrobium]EIC28952.1 hemolysin activation/secretion protein [Methylomicrobium album BG8]
MRLLNHKFAKGAAVFGVLWASNSTSVEAQSQQIPGAIQPGQIEKQLKAIPTPKADTPALKVIPEQPIPSATDGDIAFELKDVTFSGGTVYPEAELKSFFTSLLGKTVTLNQLRAAAANATVHYRNDGYVLAQVLVPKQTLQNGIVRLDIVEGHINEVRFQGDGIKDVLGLLQNYADKIRTAKPVNISAMERYLLLINDLPGINAYGSLVPSPITPGAADLVVEITQQSFSATLGFNNRLTKLLGTYRAEVYGEANNALGLQEKSYARVFQSFEDKMTVLSLGEDLPLFNEGTRLSLMLNQVWSNTSLFNIANGLNSHLVSLNIGLAHPLLRSRNSNLSVRGSFSMVDSTSSSDFFNETITSDRIRSFRAGLTYDLADSWRGINMVDLELSQGINALGARDPSDTERAAGTAKLSAAQGEVDYVKTNIYLARLQAIAPQWSFLAAFQGQYTEDVLLAPEQFSLGGEQFLRAYDPSEFIGDKGFATKAELRYTFTPFANADMTLYGFHDYGEVHYNYDRPGIAVHAAGVGMRMTVTRYFSGYVEGAKPLHPEQSTELNKDMRLFGGFKLTF